MTLKITIHTSGDCFQRGPDYIYIIYSQAIVIGMMSVNVYNNCIYIFIFYIRFFASEE